MRVIIAGTRTISNPAIVHQAIKDSGWSKQITQVICGASKKRVLEQGRYRLTPDVIGALWAIERGIPVRYFPAHWSMGRRAGPVRNEQMAQEADALILVWDGRSRGSASMKMEAIKHMPPERIFVKLVGEKP